MTARRCASLLWSCLLLNACFDDPLQGDDGETGTDTGDGDGDPGDGDGDTGDGDGDGDACGNGAVDEGEECDDGNEMDGDGCNTDCTETAKVLWEHRFNGAANGFDRGDAVAVDEDGFVYVGGSSDVGGHTDGWLRKYNAEGEAVWTRTAGGAFSDSWSALAAMPGGGVVAAGFDNLGGDDIDLYVIRYDGDGTEAWTQSFAGPDLGNDRAYSVTVEADGGVVVGGAIVSGGQLDGYVRRLDADGTPGWVDTPDYAGRGDLVHAVHAAPDGALIVAGNAMQETGLPDIWIRKYAPNRDVDWEVLQDGGNDDTDFVYDVALAENGDVFVVGFEGVDNPNSKWRMWMSRRAGADGSEVWSATHEGEESAVANGVAVESSGNVWLVGAEVVGANGFDVMYRRYTPDGDLLFAYTLDGGDQGLDHALATAVDGTDLYVVGGLSKPGEDEDLWVRKLSD